MDRCCKGVCKKKQQTKQPGRCKTKEPLTEKQKVDETMKRDLE